MPVALVAVIPAESTSSPTVISFLEPASSLSPVITSIRLTFWSAHAFFGIILQAFAEITVLLEATFLSHQSALVFALDITAIGFQLVQFSAEYLIFAQFTFQRTIVKRRTQGRLQAYLVKAFLTITEHPGIVVRKLMLQSLTQSLVESQQVGCRDALSVRWIGHHHTFLFRLCEVLDIPLLQSDVFGETSRTYILGGYGNGFVIDIISVDMVFEGPLCRIILVDGIEEFLIKVGPFLEGIFSAIHSGSDTRGYHGRFYQECATATHGVHQITFPMPSRLQDDAGSQDLIDGSLHSGLSPSTLVQTFSRGIQRECAVILCHMDVELHVGIGNTYVGTLSCLLAELVHNGIFHLISHKLAMAELIAVYYAIHGKGGVHAQILAPVYLLHGIVDLICRLGTKMLDGLENTYCGTQGEVGPVEHLLIAGKGYHPAPLFYIVCPQGSQFLCQNSLQSLEGLGYHFKFHESDYVISLIVYMLVCCEFQVTVRPSPRATRCCP